ncbi:hypothetical protein SAMN05421736_10565 [Evansella caseinilytica]|uniref:Uncharacterized protein n=1 Tax=Evansella caseinilytica TaxID=1503961 RepID=A0A1H3PIR6_9BACI|nr:hypothetical protein [Evansella caseinilytica]SDZ00898.1 hypothetical protein SAMN05421736_10565 [Evansella caseinilytica]
MLFRFIGLFIGFGLAVVGGVSLVAYLNLLTVGYTLADYGLFLLFRVELYVFFLGLVIVWSMIYFPFTKKK